jgi:hypothetical protein
MAILRIRLIDSSSAYLPPVLIIMQSNTVEERSLHLMANERWSL